MVGGGYHDAGIGVASEDAVVGVGHAGGGVAAGGLQQDLPGVDLGDLLLHQRFVDLVGDDIDILFGADAAKPFKRLLDQCFSCSQDVDELFRMGCTAHGPESGADAAGHDHAVVVF